MSVVTLFFLETTWCWAKKTLEFPTSAEKSLSISVKTFFFFFFFWRPPDFGRKKRLNFRFRPKNHSQFRWRHPNFWGLVLKIPHHQDFLDPPLAAACCCWCMATKICITSQRQRSAAYYNCLHFFYNYWWWIISLCPTMVSHDRRNSNMNWRQKQYHVVTIHLGRLLKQ